MLQPKFNIYFSKIQAYVYMIVQGIKMKDIEELIYNELVTTRQLLLDYMKRTDKRVSALERFKEKAMGICIAIGVAGKCAWDYIMEKVI